MLIAGINTMQSQGRIEKNVCIDAVPITNKSLTNKKLAKTPNRTTIIYPIALLR
jgi:hypothetical protein